MTTDGNVITTEYSSFNSTTEDADDNSTIIVTTEISIPVGL